MYARAAQIVDGIAPKADEFLLGSTLVAPPRPALGMLMKGSEDDGNRLSLVVFQPADEADQPIEPAIELLLRGASGLQNLLGRLIALVIPRVAAGERVVRVGSSEDNHAALAGLRYAATAHLVGRLLAFGPVVHDLGQRSEEHTSELQSRQYLVCRLL